jgi:uncharacterized protein (UPF0276 family)
MPAAAYSVKLFDGGDATQLGLAYGPGVPEFVQSRPGLVDYIELAFEQLRHSPGLASLQQDIPIVLHCASMSVAGFVPPSAATVDAIVDAAERTRTPWIGEHLAFVSADGLADESGGPASPTTLTYTVCPQLSEETVDRVVHNLALLRPRFSVPLILENSPQYFDVPGSTMNMVDFISNVVTHADVELLLDLSHFLITSLNTGVDAATEIERLPLERVVEIHISGFNRQSGVVWDDHAAPAPPLVFELLERVLQRARPRALTLEYNWSSRFPPGILLAHLGRARTALSQS